MPPPVVHLEADFPVSQVCANCEEVIVGEAFPGRGQSYCCSGCANGGPCICTYRAALPDEDPPEFAYLDGAAAAAGPHVEIVAGAQAQSKPEAVASASPAPLIPMPSAPIMRRPSIVRVTGLRSQLELLQLAYELEQRIAIEGLSLVRAELDDVWFEVAVDNSDALAEAMVHLEGFTIDARPHPAGVDATVRPAGAAAAGESPRATVVSMSPIRSIVRLLQRDEEPTMLGIHQPARVQPEPAAVEISLPPATTVAPIPAWEPTSHRDVASGSVPASESSNPSGAPEQGAAGR